MEKKRAAYAIESICFQVAKLDGRQQAAFIESLRGVLTAHELQALQIGIAYFRMIIDGELRDAIKAALAEKLYKDFRRHIDN